MRAAPSSAITSPSAVRTNLREQTGTGKMRGSHTHLARLGVWQNARFSFKRFARWAAAHATPSFVSTSRGSSEARGGAAVGSAPPPLQATALLRSAAVRLGIGLIDTDHCVWRDRTQPRQQASH